ncbi:MAG: glycosyltransferase [Phycisphaeraceae bacterium]|nr:glycosyltransferase [Phycisphaerae bacterium]MBX3393538.1 glycosyltransferase [Phycisphaeraceae bacterium]HRJ49299.1 glycosyltransferase family 2 protein [Phycisphaerales bacterium]
MHSAAEFAVAALLVITSAFVLSYWTVVHYLVTRTSRLVPTARAGVAMSRHLLAQDPSTLPSVCVVVPAHNEAAVIGGLVTSLLNQDYPRLSFVFCLDRCTDDTRDVILGIARSDPRFHIHEVTQCPPDWAGKVHALWSGVNGTPEAARADVLLFADADTAFSPSCVSATLAMMRERGLQMLSLLSTLTHRAWFEMIAQPPATLKLINQFPLIQANRRTPRRPFANGQFIMMTRGAYEAIGGHRAVQNEILEDVALARLAARHSIPAGIFLSDGVMHCRMYGDWAAFRRGWKRIFTEGFNRKASRLRKAARTVRFTWAIAPVGVLLLCVAWAVITAPLQEPDDIWPAGFAAVALFTWITALVRISIRGHSPLWSVLAHPVGSWIVADLLLEAARDLESGVPTYWGGRTYQRASR